MGATLSDCRISDFDVNDFQDWMIRSQPHAIEWLDDRVDVIVHDYISMDTAALLVEEQQR